MGVPYGESMQKGKIFYCYIFLRLKFSLVMDVPFGVSHLQHLSPLTTLVNIHRHIYKIGILKLALIVSHLKNTVCDLASKIQYLLLLLPPCLS